MKIDVKAFELLEIKIELSLIEEHFKLLCNEIDSIFESMEKEYIKSYSNDDPDEAEEYIEYGLYSQNVNENIPRLFWGPFIVSLWSILESSYIEISNQISSIQNQQLKLNDINGGIINQVKKYFSHVLKISYMPDKFNWESIIDLYAIRNAFAHKNGRFDLLDEGKQKKIKNMVKKEVGLVITNDCIILKKKFVETKLTDVKTLIEYLINEFSEIKNS